MLSHGDGVKTVLRVAVACALGILFSLAAQGVAAAHADVVSSTPASGGSITEPPNQIVLEFSAPVIARLSEVVVRDAEGVVHEADRLSAVGEGQLVAVVDPTGPDGVWMVDYRVVSVDGHATEGTFGFAVDSSSTPPAGAATGPPVRWLIAGLAALMVLSAAVLVHAQSRPSRAPSA